ncbi:MAG TPA: hypothetical protein PLK82_12490 [Bacteroidales bacterium]|nr:hypothetical protein [Bacteroidales bacterium]
MIFVSLSFPNLAKMKQRTAFLTMLLLFAGVICAQKPAIQPDDPAFRDQYKHFNFHGAFAVMIDQDEISRYFLVNLAELPSRFERVWFMNLAFQSDKVVNIDPDLAKDWICFKSSGCHASDSVLRVFNELKVKTQEKAAEWPDSKKSLWLKENDKYK